MTLEGDAAVVIVLIKPDKTADFESVIAKYKEALGKSDKPARKEQLAGMKIFKSPTAMGGNTAYIISVDPVVKGEEYDITRVITEVFPVGSDRHVQQVQGSVRRPSDHRLSTRFRRDWSPRPGARAPGRAAFDRIPRRTPARWRKLPRRHQPSQNASPTKPVVEPSPDPASVHFLSDAGLLLVAIKPTAVADYEQVIRALQEALAKDDRHGARDGREGMARLQGHRERREGQRALRPPDAAGGDRLRLPAFAAASTSW